MRSMFVLIRWELQRVLSNWRQTMAVLLIPSVALLAALYVFPFLVDYLSTGNVGRAPVILVAPDASFQEFIRSDTLASSFTYKTWSMDDYRAASANGQAAEETGNGSIILVFQTSFQPDVPSAAANFGDALRLFFDQTAAGDTQAKSEAVLAVYSDPNTIMSATTAVQFQQSVLPGYKDFLMRTVGNSIYQAGGGDPFLMDHFNPYTKLMEYRSTANLAGARVIPGVLILLLYYCVYSLSGDILAAERERGFLSKLTLTPLSTRALLWGKALAITAISAGTSAVTLAVLLLSSWFNRSNNPLSLIPFGLMMTPAQLGLILLSVLCAALLMTMYCFKVILDLAKMQDVLLNLQLPLLLFLFDFFLQLFRPSSSVLAEYAIPLHNNLLLIHDTMAGILSPGRFVFVCIYDLIIVSLLFRSARRSFEPEKASKNRLRRFA